MPFEIPFILQVILGIFLFQLALLWLALPFAIYGIKKRMQVAKEQRDELLQEIFWLRKTVETIPGAAGVARRHSQKFMQEITQKERAAAGEEESGGDSKKKAAKVTVAEKKADKGQAAKKTTTKANPAKKSAAGNRDNEPQLSVPKPAASLLEDDELEDEEDPEAYGDYDDDEPPAKKKAKKKAAVAEDHDDIEDDSLDYLDDDTDSSHLLVGMPMQSSAKEKAQAMTNMVVEIPPEDEISESEDGFFVYRGKNYDNLLDAMKQQQGDAKKPKAKAS